MGMAVYNWLITHFFEISRKIVFMCLFANEYLYLIIKFYDLLRIIFSMQFKTMKLINLIKIRIILKNNNLIEILKIIRKVNLKLQIF